MAKKQQPKYSYAPNTGLIGGEAQVAASEAGLSNVGQSFVTGAASVFGAIKQANAERDARMEAYESEIGGLVNTNQFEDPKNKQVIKGFLNTQRDEFIKLSKIYDKTKDRDVKDKMEEIKFSLVNLNDQIKVFNQDKLDYRTASDENQLASLKTYDRTGDDFFTSAFTNDAAFSIDEMGDINFGINNNSYKYKDKAGKWESKNNIDESNLLKIYGQSYSDGGQGKAFNSGNVRRGLYNSFKNTGNSALKVFVTTDLTSDESSLSFEEQFASGELNKEMYAGFTEKADGTYDTDWMFENKNGDLLRNKVSDYLTKVVEDGHGQGKADNYRPESKPPTTTTLFGNTVTLPQTGGERLDFAIVENIGAGKKEVTVKGVKYKYDSKTEMYSYPGVETKMVDGEKVETQIIKQISREDLIGRQSAIYNASSNYFTTGENKVITYNPNTGFRSRKKDYTKKGDKWYYKDKQEITDPKLLKLLEPKLR